jgi:hypothetical protein
MNLYKHLNPNKWLFWPITQLLENKNYKKKSIIKLLIYWEIDIENQIMEFRWSESRLCQEIDNQVKNRKPRSHITSYGI